MSENNRISDSKVEFTTFSFLALVLSLPFSLAISAVAADPQQGDKPPFDTFVRDYAAERHFNGTILVEDDGRTLYRGSFGLADRAFHVPCTPDTKFKIAS